MTLLTHILTHPLTRGLDIDDPRTTALRRRIIREKPFLLRIYREWYSALVESLPTGDGAVLELGSGAGFLDEVLSGVITSEIFACPGVRLVADGQLLPLADESLRGIVMSDVLHHIPNPRRFFTEAGRCVRAGGVVAMIEPWVTGWSKLVYTRLHHEPFRPDADEWEIPRGGPLSGANGAMPWILFHRDRRQFEQEFPQWEIRGVEPLMPLRYLLSGGVSKRSLMPGWSFGVWRGIEAPLCRKAAMFAKIVLVKRGE
jgi:SAM-dependent methyltransferase